MGNLKLVVSNNYYINNRKKPNLYLIVDNEKPSFLTRILKNTTIMTIVFEFKKIGDELNIKNYHLLIVGLLTLMVGVCFTLTSSLFLRFYGVATLLVGISGFMLFLIAKLQKKLLSKSFLRKINKMA